MRVLLIEDDSATAQSIELMLKAENFDLYLAFIQLAHQADTLSSGVQPRDRNVASAPSASSACLTIVADEAFAYGDLWDPIFG